MTTVIQRTKAGAAHDKAVRNGDKPAAAFKHIILLTGDPVTNIPSILNLTTWDQTKELHRFTRRSAEDSDFPLTDAGDTWSRFEPHLTPDQGIGIITAIAMVLEDNTLWGYAPYLPADNGLTKTSGFDWVLDLLIAESIDSATALQFTYSPIDYRSLRDKLLAEVGGSSNTANMLPLAGGTMAGNIVFNQTLTGITWGMNSDGAKIRFKNDKDSDLDSYLEYQTSDNGNEYHRWTHTNLELMRLVPNDEISPLKVRNNKIVWHEGNLDLLIAALTKAGFGQPPAIPTNNPPSTPTITTDLPTIITRGSSYTVVFTSTDPDGDSVTYNLSNLVGCTAAKTTGITSAGTSITIGAQADIVSFAVIAVDAKGAASAAAPVTRPGSAIVNPTGSTGWLTAGLTHVIAVPDWANTITMTGHGAAGSEEEVYEPYAGPYFAADGSIQYEGGYSTHYTKGADTTIQTGSTILATFAGSANTSTPTNTIQIKTLSSSTGRSLTVVIPTDGALKLDWS